MTCASPIETDRSRLLDYKCGIPHQPNEPTKRFPPLLPAHPTTAMESHTGQSPLVASSTVRYYLSVVCLGWYAFHWFIQLAGAYAALVTFPS